MTAPHDADFKHNEWEATVSRYKKEYHDAQRAVDKQTIDIVWLGQDLKEIIHSDLPRWIKDIRKNELESKIQAAEKVLGGLEERAEAYSTRLRMANPNPRDKGRIEHRK